MDTIQTAVSGASGTTGVLSAVAVVGGTLTTMGTQVTSTVSGLQNLNGDTKGELKSAFTQSSACTSADQVTGTARRFDGMRPDRWCPGDRRQLKGWPSS